MTRTQRSVHRLIWPILALVVGFGFAMALALRPPPPADVPITTEEPRQ
jgi:hypothetical protein